MGGRVDLESAAASVPRQRCSSAEGNFKFSFCRPLSDKNMAAITLAN